VLEQLAEIGLEADVLLEPMRRDSGPAIAAGAAFAEARDKDAIVLALAADHVVSDTPAFLAACREGLAAAEAGHIVTFGVQPERAATEYGYINPGEAISGKVRAVAKFVEKPDPTTAAGYIKAGYLWNSGNFMFRASVLSDEYRNVDAESVQAVTDAVARAGTDLGFVKLDEAAFGSAAGPMSAPGMRYGNCPARTARATRRGGRRCLRIRAIATCRPTARWSR
jgi:mannose-1-phosphate guanylyltransferase/mannose-6-phosphate isomerase